MAELKLPDWVLREEHYKPSGDRDFFISRSLLRLMGLMRHIRRQAKTVSEFQGLAAGRFVLVFTVVLLTVATHMGAFLLLILAAELVLLCFMPGSTILRILRNASLAMLFSALILLPSLFLGSTPAMVLIPLKTFLTVTCLSILNESMPWNVLTASLRVFHVPQIFIHILDIAIKYIVLLGEISLDMLSALKLRSVGKNPAKKQAFSAVLGVTFLKSHEMSEEMYRAMVCRCFTGDYPAFSGKCWRTEDMFLLVSAVVLVLAYSYIEGVFL